MCLKSVFTLSCSEAQFSASTEDSEETSKLLSRKTLTFKAFECKLWKLNSKKFSFCIPTRAFDS